MWENTLVGTKQYLYFGLELVLLCEIKWQYTL